MKTYAIHLATDLDSPANRRWVTACGRAFVEYGDGRGPWSGPTASLEASEVTCATCRRSRDYHALRAAERAEERDMPDNVVPLRRRP